MTSHSRRGHSPSAQSPYGNSFNNAKIQESDFEYMEPDRRPSTIRREDVRYSDEAVRHSADDENAPDVIKIRHLNTLYPIRFKPYAISDGLVTIGDIRYFAAKELAVGDERRLKLLYKGKVLKDDDKIAKAEGLKQLSEVMVVVSDGVVQASGSEDSEVDAPRGSSTIQRKKSSRRRKSKAAPPPARDSASPSVTSSAASTSSPPTTTSPTHPPNSPRGKVEQLATVYKSQWVPLCREYLTRPPVDPKAKDFEHKRLTESILAQIILKADDIEMDGDQLARSERKALVNEAQEMLKRLDAVVGKKS